MVFDLVCGGREQTNKYIYLRWNKGSPRPQEDTTIWQRHKFFGVVTEIGRTVSFVLEHGYIRFPYIKANSVILF